MSGVGHVPQTSSIVFFVRAIGVKWVLGRPRGSATRFKFNWSHGAARVRALMWWEGHEVGGS